MQDDLVRPDGLIIAPNLNHFGDIHNNFAMHCKTVYISVLGLAIIA